MKRQKKTRNTGQGTLFKRKGGKRYNADAPIKANFYLRYTKDGKGVTIALKDEYGKPITDHATAKEYQDRLTAPARIKNEEHRIKAVASMLSDVEERRQQAEIEARRHERLTYADSWKAYLKQKTVDGATMAKRTADSYFTYWTQYIGWMRVQLPSIQAIADTTEEHAKGYAVYLSEQGETNKTRNCKIGFMKSFFATLQDAGHVKHNPFACIKPLKFKPQTKGKRALSIDELKALIETAQGEYRTLFMVGSFTGLRLMDAALLKWSSVNMEKCVITVTPKKTENTSGAEVHIGIPVYLQQHLMTLDSDDEYVMPDIAQRYLTGRSRSVSKTVQQIFKDAGIQRTKHSDGRKVSAYAEGFHALRHSFVSIASERGAPIAVIQQIVGHTSTAMTTHYQHTSAQAAKDTAQLIDWSDTPSRTPLPQWAVELIQGMTPENMEQVKTELLS